MERSIIKLVDLGADDPWHLSVAWEEALENLEGEFEELPSIPLPTRSIISLTASTSTPMETDEEDPAAEPEKGGKRKAPTGKGQTKKTKLSDGTAASKSEEVKDGFESIFAPEMLKQPKLLSMEEMEKALVERQKKILLEEYGA